MHFQEQYKEEEIKLILSFNQLKEQFDELNYKNIKNDDESEESPKLFGISKYNSKSG